MQSILIAEDSEEDLETIRRIFSRTSRVPLIRCRDGAAVLSYLTTPPAKMLGKRGTTA